MTVVSTFEDRLRLKVSCYFPGDGLSVCTVYQQDLADALSLIEALRGANQDRAEIIAALAKTQTDRVLADPPRLPHAPDPVAVFEAMED